MKYDGRFFADESDTLKEDKEGVMTAVTRHGGSIIYASKELQADHEVIIAAIQQDGCSIRFKCIQSILDKDLALMALSINTYALEYL